MGFTLLSMVVIGVFLAVAGLALAIAPLGAARLANSVRFVPYSSSDGAVRYYRLSGVVMALIGVVVAVLAS